MNDSTAEAPRALLRARDAVAIIVGIVIGAGIYRTPPMVADVTGDAGWMLAMWVLGGVVSLIGALCYAELASAYPHTGGDYHFLTRAFGRNVSFLYAWARATVINTGSIALLSFVFGDYLSRIVGLGPHSAALWAAFVIVALTIVNLVSLEASARTQNWLTVLEASGLMLVIAAGMIATPAAPAPSYFASTPPIGLLGLSMVFVLLTYGGWNEAAYLSAEVRGGHRAIVGTLVVSIAIVTVLYVATNVALLAGLGFADLAKSKAAPADVVTRAFGAVAGGALAGFVAVATLTSINATMLVGARTNYALSGDWASLRIIGGWNAARGVPVRAHLVQSAIALALVAFGAAQKDGFEAMVEFTAPVFWGFLTLVGVALFVLRSKDRDRARPFRVPLFPLTPAIFVAVCGYLCWSSIGYAVSRSAIHVCLLVMAAGVVALLLARTRK
ncbi:MAG: amino acid permease [Burkholderiales bacterium]